MDRKTGGALRFDRINQLFHQKNCTYLAHQKSRNQFSIFMKYRHFSLIALFVVCLVACNSEQTVNHRKYGILTTAKEIADFYKNIRLDTSGRSEKTTIDRHFDGSYQLEYIYDLLESEQYDPFYYSVQVDVERNEKEASKSLMMSKTLFKTVNSAVGLEAVPFDSLSLPGDESYYYVRTKNGEPNGILLGIRSNNRIFTIISSGIYSDDQSMLTDLILPKLDSLGSFSLDEE